MSINEEVEIIYQSTRVPLSSCVFSWFKQADWPSCELTLVVTCVRSPGKYNLENSPTYSKKPWADCFNNNYSKLLASKVILGFPIFIENPSQLFGPLNAILL